MSRIGRFSVSRWICVGVSIAAVYLLVLPINAEEPIPSQEKIRAAITKSIPLIEASSAEYLAQRECFSCHHTAMSVIALSEAREHGFEIDEKNFTAQLERAATHLDRGRGRYTEGRGQGGGVDTAGYALWALGTGEQKSSETTTAVTEYLLQKDADRDHWKRSGSRPPSEASHMTTTGLAILGLRDFGTKEQAERIESRNQQVLEWLLANKATDTEDHVFRLSTLFYLAAGNESISEAADLLRKRQRDDGGWSQTDDMKSDAYATGTALVALARYGELATDDPAYRRGLAYLLKTQGDDGSWHVKTRSKPIQKYFESGFPHGKDQFISMAGTCWSVTALALGCNDMKDEANQP